MDKKNGRAPGRDQPVYKTEEMLKQEARERFEEEARLEALKPPQSTRKKKIDNFIYHYKWQTAAIVIGALLAALFLRDTLFRPKPDMMLIIATSRYIPEYETAALQTALEKHMGDFNGDGKVLLSLDPIYLPLEAIPGGSGGGGRELGSDSYGGGADADGGADAADGGSDGAGAGGSEERGGVLNEMMPGADPQLIQASMMKLMAVISSATDPLYLLDDEMYRYLTEMAGASQGDGATAGDGAGADGGVGNGVDLDDGVGNGVDMGNDADLGAGIVVGADEGDNMGAGGGEGFSMFAPLSDIAAASGPLGDRLAIADTLLAQEPGCEGIGDLTFCLRPLNGSKQKKIDYIAYCMRILKEIS